MTLPAIQLAQPTTEQIFGDIRFNLSKAQEQLDNQAEILNEMRKLNIELVKDSKRTRILLDDIIDSLERIEARK